MRVLFLTQRLPFAPNRGDRVRAYHLLKSIASWASVDLISLVHDPGEASHIGDLASLTATTTVLQVPRVRTWLNSLLVLPTIRPLTHTLLDAPDLDSAVARVVGANRPDVVVAFCSGMARLALLPTVRQIPLVHDMVDVDSEKWAALAAVASEPRAWIYRREARCLAVFEARVTRHARVTLLSIEKERADLLDISPESCIDVLQNGVDVESLQPRSGPPASGSGRVVFCGVMNYAPNESGALWFVREVWPRIRTAMPQAHLQLVGSNPTRRIRRLASEADRVEVTGHVADVRPYLWGADVAVAPIKTARGIQNKVLEAVAAGLPTVVTPAVRGGLPPEVLSACLTADDAEAFAQSVVELLRRSPGDRRTIAQTARLDALTWPARLRGVRELIESAVTSRRIGGEV